MASRQETVRGVLDQVKSDGRTSLTAPECKAVCDAYDIPTPNEGLARSAEEAVSVAESVGYPVVMKIVSPDILHKTEAGGVLVLQQLVDTIVDKSQRNILFEGGADQYHLERFERVYRAVRRLAVHVEKFFRCHC